MKKIPSLSAIFLILISFICAGSPTVEGVDWPQWGGPNGNFSSAERGYDPQAFADGVNILWETDVGIGYSSVVISDGWLYTLGDVEGVPSVFCIKLKNGRIRWVAPIQNQRGGKVQSTPATDGEHVYAFSPMGDVFCLEADNGKTVWNVNLAEQYKMATVKYGISSSPILFDDMVMVNGNDVLVAFDKMTGQEVWFHNDKKPFIRAGIYSTPHTASIDENLYLIRQGHNRLEAFNPQNGEVVAGLKVIMGGDTSNIDDGIVDNARVLIGGLLAATELFRFNGREFIVEWENADLKVDVTPFVFVDGYLYGFEKDRRAPVELGLTCVDASNGQKVWNEDVSYGGITVVDDIFFLLAVNGTIITADLSPTGYHELSRGNLTGREFLSPAVVSGGRLYARDFAGTVYCVDVAAK